MILRTICAQFALISIVGTAFAQKEAYEDLGAVIRTPLAAGVQHAHVRTKDPLSIHVVEVDMKAKGVSLEAALGQDRLGGEEKVSSIAARKDALVAINAGFPVGKEQTPGLIIASGELVSSPANRSAFAVKRDGTPVIGKWTETRTWKAKIITPEDAVRELGPMNVPCADDALALFTAAYGDLSPGAGKQKITELLLDGSRKVKEIRTGEPGFNLEGGAVVLAGRDTGATWLQEHFKEGDRVTLDLRTDPPWQDLDMAMAAGPLLIRSGTHLQDPVSGYPDGEDLDPAYKKANYNKAISRAAIGISRDKTKVFLVAIDGEQPKFSIGVTQKKLADLLRQMNVYDAIEVGFGHDVTMVVNGNVVNEPVFQAAKDGSGGSEKPVFGALLVKRK